MAGERVHFDSSLICESSGIVRSPKYPDVYWTLNDSGDEAYLYPVTAQGKLIIPAGRESGYRGVRITGAVNVDWEDIATDKQGNLVIGAFGNNWNMRRDLGLYVVPEPDPHTATEAPVARRIAFRYPDQHAFPPPEKECNFDAEALFCDGDNYFILTKRRGDGRAYLYSFGPLISLTEINMLVLRETYDIGGLVTAADLSPDGKQLAVLTPEALWLFDRDGDKFLSGPARRLPLVDAKQCEAVCFDGDALLLTNEQGELWRYPLALLNQLAPVRR